MPCTSVDIMCGTQLEESTSSPSTQAVKPATVVATATGPQRPTVLVPKKKKLAPTVVTAQPATELQPAVRSKNDKKRIAPLLMESESDASTTNAASSKNNIRNILSPMVPSPTAADANLMASRLDQQSSSVPAPNEAHVVPVRHKTVSAGVNISASTEAPRENGSTGKHESKKVGADGASLKRKRDSERSSMQPAAAKTREVTVQAPVLLNERFAGQTTRVCYHMSTDDRCAMSCMPRCTAARVAGGQAASRCSRSFRFACSLVLMSAQSCRSVLEVIAAKRRERRQCPKCPSKSAFTTSRTPRPTKS